MCSCRALADLLHSHSITDLSQSALKTYNTILKLLDDIKVRSIRVLYSLALIKFSYTYEYKGYTYCI